MKGKMKMVAVLTVFAVILAAIWFKNVNQPNDTLFPRDEIDVENIVAVEVIDYHLNKTIVTKEKDFIKQMPAVLINIPSNNITQSADHSENPIYIVHISNNDNYPNPGISVYEHYIEYQGRSIHMTEINSSKLRGLLKDEFENQQ